MPDQTTNFIIQPGYVKIEQLTLNSPHAAQVLDLSKIVEEFGIHENLMQPFITANFFINDVTSLFTLFPLTGDETIWVKFSIPEPSFEKEVNLKFRVISIRDVVTGEHVRQVKYVMRCILPEAFKDWTTKIRKSYANMPIKDMAKQVYDTYLKDPQSETFTDNNTGVAFNNELEPSNTEGLRTIVIPNMPPSEALAFLAKEAKSDVYAPSNFVFFANADGYWFKTVDQLIDDGNKIEIKDKYFLTEKNFFIGQQPMCTAPIEPLSIQGIQDAINGTGKKPFEFMKISDYKFINIFDLENNLRAGAFDAATMVIDPPVMTFERETYKYNYTKDYSKFQRADKEAKRFIFENSEIGRLKGESHQRYIISNKGEATPTPDQKHLFLHYLAGSASMLDYVALEITVPGDPDRRVGDIITIGFPEYSGFDETIARENAFLAGEYLVTAVKHFYNLNNELGYQLVMQCVKNCYHKSPEEAKMDFADEPPSSISGEVAPTEVLPDVLQN